MKPEGPTIIMIFDDRVKRLERKVDILLDVLFGTTDIEHARPLYIVGRTPIAEKMISASEQLRIVQNKIERVSVLSFQNEARINGSGNETCEDCKGIGTFVHGENRYDCKMCGGKGHVPELVEVP